MICKKCGYDDSVENQKHNHDPWCMYQVKGGEVINDMFHPDRIPDGWYDSPGAAKEAVKLKNKKKPGRPAKVDTNGNSSRSDK